MENSSEPVATLYWFDQDLRLDDNPALDLAIRGASRFRRPLASLPGSLERVMILPT